MTTTPDVGRGPVELTPASNSNNVSTNASVFVRYSAGFFDDALNPVDVRTAIELIDEEGFGVPGRAQVAGDVLIFTPDDPLDADADYTGQARGLDSDLGIAFRTGSTRDMAPPTFITDIDEVEVDSTPLEDDCEGFHRIDVSFPPANDDGPLGDIEYQLFLSRSDGIGAPELVSRVRNCACSEIIMSFVIDPADAGDQICIQLKAIDGVRQESLLPEVKCFDPLRGAFFDDLCSVSAAGGVHSRSGSGSTAAGALMMGMLALVLRRRR